MSIATHRCLSLLMKKKVQKVTAYKKRKYYTSDKNTKILQTVVVKPASPRYVLIKTDNEIMDFVKNLRDI